MINNNNSNCNDIWCVYAGSYYRQVSKQTVCICLLWIMRTYLIVHYVTFCGVLFLTSGDVSSWFQSQNGQPYSCLVEACALHIHWDLPLAWHGSQAVFFHVPASRNCTYLKLICDQLRLSTLCTLFKGMRSTQLDIQSLFRHYKR